MDNLQHSRPIDVHRISEYPEVQNVISYLLSLLKEEGFIKNSPRQGILKHLKVVSGLVYQLSYAQSYQHALSQC